MNFSKHIPKNTWISGLSIVSLSCVFIFSVYFAQPEHRYVQINYVNSTLLVAFLVLTISFGVFIGLSRTYRELAGAECKLSQREQEIVQLIISGKKNTEIANELFVELSTVKSHINNIYKKEKVGSRHEIKEKYRYFVEKPRLQTVHS